MSVNGQSGWVYLPAMEEKLVTVSLSVLIFLTPFPFLTVLSMPFSFFFDFIIYFSSNGEIVPAESFRLEPSRVPSPEDQP